ncbi:MAG: hypothetical protein ISR65_10980 [Bacteriovoracaceae bacterium]|nr:hypothetical protein [Bacteriovoracaceae bacterium]
MNKGLLVVERFILESLIGEAKNFDEIQKDTKLSQSLLSNTLSILLTRNIIRYRCGNYSINKSKENQWRPIINDTKNIQEEIKDLFISLINDYFDEDQIGTLLRVRKVYLTPFEEKILKAHLSNLEEFVRNIEIEQRKPTNLKTNKMHEKKLIFWGASNYLDVTQGTFKAI